MESMIERVARAIAGKLDDNTPWKECGQGFRETCILLARAAIEAMREPTEAMLDAYSLTSMSWNDEAVAKSVWYPMIDAALKEHEGEKVDGS